MDGYIYSSPWFRIAWHDGVFCLGLGFDFEQAILGIYAGPFNIFIGYNDYIE